jgi:hypothetical protein
MKSPPADEVVPEPVFAPKEDKPLNEEKPSKEVKPLKEDKPCPEPVKPKAKKHKKKEESCEPNCKVVNTPDPLSGGDGLGAIVKAAVKVMSQPEPLESLARRAQDNIRANGVSNDVKEMASKALDTLNNNEEKELASRAL